MQKNPPGYPLPSGELGEDDIVCQLVYLPDRPEYWQALLGALSYMATWKAWERDDDKRGKDAASDWRDALELTIGCWRMACLEELTQDVEDILKLLQNKKDCCDDSITYLPVDEITTDIVPNVGDPPDYYGETAVADWDEWNEYLCYTAHQYVDYLAHVGDTLYEASRNSAIVIGVIAAALSLLAFSGIGLPIAFTLAAAVVSGIILTGSISIFDDSEDDIEAARDDIVCAILNDGDIGAAVDDALGSDTAWDVFYQFIPYESAKAIMYEGGNDGEYLPAETKDDCASCDVQYVCDDVYIEVVYGSNLTCTDGEYSALAAAISGCNQLYMKFWTDDTKTVAKSVRIKVLTCGGGAACSTYDHHTGWLVYPNEVFGLDHPNLPDTDDGVIDQMRSLHTVAEALYYVTFELYAP